MADTDMIEVTFTQQKVYHDGTSMVVAKEGDTKAVEARLVAGLIADEVIKKPKGWAADVAEKDRVAVADGQVHAPPAAPVEPGAKQAKADPAPDAPPA